MELIIVSIIVIAAFIRVGRLLTKRESKCDKCGGKDRDCGGK